MRTQPFLQFVLLSMLLVGAAAPVGAEHEGAEAAGHGEHHNHFSVFVGSTQAEEMATGDREDPRFTLGVDYERRLSRRFGIGGLLDRVVEGEREALLGLPLFFHTGRRAKLFVAPSVQRAAESDESEFVARFGFAYDFHAGGVTLAPTAAVDVADGHQIYVLGLSVGWGF